LTVNNKNFHHFSCSEAERLKFSLSLPLPRGFSCDRRLFPLIAA
jgi:hypothetical protein